MPTLATLLLFLQTAYALGPANPCTAVISKGEILFDSTGQIPSADFSSAATKAIKKKGGFRAYDTTLKRKFYFLATEAAEPGDLASLAKVLKLNPIDTNDQGTLTHWLTHFEFKFRQIPSLIRFRTFYIATGAGASNLLKQRKSKDAPAAPAPAPVYVPKSLTSRADQWADELDQLIPPETRARLEKLDRESPATDFGKRATGAREKALLLYRSELKSELANFDGNQLLARDPQTDSEMSALVAEEQAAILSKLKSTRLALAKAVTTPEDAAVIEIKPDGTLYTEEVRQLRDMYRGLASKMKWKFEVLATAPGRNGYVESTALRIEGANAFSLLRDEAGIHRFMNKGFQNGRSFVDGDVTHRFKVQVTPGRELNPSLVVTQADPNDPFVRRYEMRREIDRVENILAGNIDGELEQSFADDALAAIVNWP